MWICWIRGNGCSRGAFRMLNCRAFCISLKMKWVFCTKLNRGGCPLPWSPGVAPSAGRCHCQPAAAPRGEYFSNDTLIYNKLVEPPDHDFLLATFKPSVPAWLPSHSVKPTNTKYGSSSWFFSLSAENMHGILKPCRQLPTKANIYRQLPSFADNWQHLPTFADFCRLSANVAVRRPMSVSFLGGSL